ncbi:conserved protein of unknown function [Maridesulfovibrio hydrothermalis AM13 = DSM 14728]|uniref:Uncharacterized protein n=2 Tax=Maridesulfovibrio TaxID=2794998 RepID=L0R8X5_9BACT|nr:conserved protein of unknown function [Maridesulfovibrio hydrothermalis AM13 = DSM 14728]
MDGFTFIATQNTLSGWSMSFKNVTQFVWKRHQSHWNWIVMAGSLVVFLMALLTHSVLLFFTTAAGIVISLQKFPDPVPPFSWVAKMLECERKWLELPWSWKKSLQACGMVAGVIYVVCACWAGSIMALLLFIGLCANIACVYGNKAMGVDEL